MEGGGIYGPEDGSASPGVCKAPTVTASSRARISYLMKLSVTPVSGSLVPGKRPNATDITTLSWFRSSHHFGPRQSDSTSVGVEAAANCFALFSLLRVGPLVWGGCVHEPCT